MTKRRYILPILLAALVFYFAMPLNGSFQLATAGENLESVNPNDGVRYTCASLTEAKGGVLLGRVIPCLLHTIEKTTIVFADELITILQPLFYAFLTLVVTLFGVRVLQGEREIGPQAFLLVVKIAFVIGMLEWIPYQSSGVPGDMKGGIESVYGIISDGVAITTGALDPINAGISCDINAYGDANTPMIWKQMDCVVGKLYGFATGTGTNPDGTKPVNILLASSAVGLLTGFFFGGTLGVTVFFALIGVLWSVLMLVMRVALAFVNGYLIVCIMLILSPLLMPLVFLKVTNDYFERWWKIIMGGLLMPIIIASYAMFALLMYDRLLFSQDSLLQNLFNEDMVKNARMNAVKPCDMQVTNDPKFKVPSGTTQADMDTMAKNPFVQNFVQPLLSGGSDACGLFKVPKFDISKMSGIPAGENGGKEAMVKLFHDSIKLFIMAFLISAGLSSVQSTVTSLVGSSSSGAALNARSETETKLMQGFSEMKSKLTQAVSGGKYGEGLKEKDFTAALRGGIKTAKQDFASSLAKTRK